MSNSDAQAGKAPAVHSESPTNPDPPENVPNPQREKDAWDKAQIASGFLASVVIAVVGILINISIQRAQIDSSEASTRAQIDVSERNNKAQLALTERTAEIQRRLQEATLVGQLTESLAGDSSLKKQLAIVVLRRSIPPDTYQDVITLIVRSETDPAVRKTALEQAATLRDVAPAVVQAIGQAANDATRPSEERQLAANAMRQLGLRSTAPLDTYVLFSSGEREVSFEDNKLGSSVFAHYLLRGLTGEASPKTDKNIRLSALSDFVTKGVRTETRLSQIPGLSTPPNGSDPIIVGPGAKYSKIVSLAIGNSAYKQDIGALQFPATNAKLFSTFWQSHGADTTLLINATRVAMLDALRSTNDNADGDSLQLLYYSGHAFTLEGLTWLAPVDSDLNRPTDTSVSAQEVSDFWSKSSARAKILFLDIAFPRLTLSSK